ncbi:MAG: hypothetical protein ABR987_01285 [Terracidiphilus sp.]|jgi:hypothetical protein
MIAGEQWRWTFLAYLSVGDGQVVQKWFNSLSVEAQEEIADLCQNLAVVTDRLWRRPEFDPLDGAGGISELRPADIRCADGSKTYRIYGFFGPGEHEYTFLHGSEKSVKNDRYGKRIARERLTLFLFDKNQTTTHEFDFSGGRDPAIEKGPGGAGKLLKFPTK